VNGLVAILSRDPAVLAQGPTALGPVCGVEEHHSAHAVLQSAFLGVCGESAFRDLTVIEPGPDVRPHALAAAVSGEIVNAVALTRELGLEPADASPARLALAAYERWGAGLFTRLEGVFCLVIRDDQEDLTLAGVDPRSIDSLFAARIGDDVWLASAAKVFRRDPRFVARMDDDSLAQMLTLGYMPAGGSLFAGAGGLPLGFHFEVRGGTVARVRHADDRDLCGGELRGSAYLDHLEETISALVVEAFAGAGTVLPLTGGLDSRLLAAALPVGVRPPAFTFGGPYDDDVRGGRSIAAACGLEYRRFDLTPDYLSTCAAMTVHISEGRLNPAANITGCLMENVSDQRDFVSGQGGEFGRRFMKAVNLLPDRQVLLASGGDFVDLAVRRHYRPLLDTDRLHALLGADAEAFSAAGYDVERRAFAATQGLHNADRLDLYGTELAFWFSRPQLLFNRAWIGVRAPFHSQRWVAAVLAGAPSERVDDLARLRLIRRLDPHVAAVPWALTHLSLPASESVLLGLRQAARLTPAAGRLPRWLRASAGAAGARAKERLYSHGEKREVWIRTRAGAYLEDVLLGPRCLQRGLFREAGVRRLLDEQMAGADHAKALGQLLNVELWQRQFVDGDVEQPLQGCPS
jgi:hypothetical protein